MKPYNDKEKAEIARLRKAGHEDSYILGQMKVVRRSNQVPPIRERSEPMATKKKAKKKPAAKKKAATKKKTTAGRKPAKKAGRKKGGFQCGETLTAVQNQDDQFYKQYPRYKAYQLICKKKKMATAAFVDAVEKLDGVKTRGQALGILQKLLDKGCVKATGKPKATK